jgi:hypothetical protein
MEVQRRGFAPSLAGRRPGRWQTNYAATMVPVQPTPAPQMNEHQGGRVGDSVEEGGDLSVARYPTVGNRNHAWSYQGLSQHRHLASA